MLRFALIFAVVVVAFDAVCAGISKVFSINYDTFVLLGLFVYAILGVVAGSRLRSWRALISVAIAAIADVTVGWFVAALIGPGQPSANTSAFQLVALAILIAAVYTGFGAFGVRMGIRAGRSAA